MTVQMADLTAGTRVRHVKWDTTGTIRVVGDVTEIRWDGSWVQDEISDEGVVFPGDVEIIREES
jgi:hypothetical protein